MSMQTELRALAARAKEIAGTATPGPWGSHQGDRWIGTKIVGRGEARSIVAKVYHNREKTNDDAAFIAAARTLVPELADAVIALADECDRRNALGYAGVLERAEKAEAGIARLKDKCDRGQMCHHDTLLVRAALAEETP